MIMGGEGERGKEGVLFPMFFFFSSEWGLIWIGLKLGWRDYVRGPEGAPQFLVM